MTRDVILILPGSDTTTLHEATASMFEDAFISAQWETTDLPGWDLQVDVIENHHVNDGRAIHPYLEEGTRLDADRHRGTR